MSELVTVGIDASLTRTALVAWPARTYAIIPTGPETALHLRLRRIAEEVYAFVAAAGAGVLVVVETPGYIPERAGGRGHSVDAIYGLGRAQGAALAGLPRDARAELATPAQWRAELKIAGGPQAKAHVAAYLAGEGVELPYRSNRELDADVADAFGLAIYATRIARRPHPGIRRGRGR